MPQNHGTGVLHYCGNVKKRYKYDFLLENVRTHGILLLIFVLR